MKKILFLIIPILLLTGCSYKDNSGQVSQLQKQNQELQDKLDQQNSNTPTNSEPQTQDTQSTVAQKRINELRGITTPPSSADIDLQAKCADSATKEFKTHWNATDPLTSYTNHWNKKLGKCFILVESYISADAAREKDLYDVYELKQYGVFFSSNSTRELGNPDCEIYPDGNKSSFQKCNSEIEFDKYAATYMNN